MILVLVRDLEEASCDIDTNFGGNREGIYDFYLLGLVRGVELG
jgi:hypothetical protein